MHLYMQCFIESSFRIGNDFVVEATQVDSRLNEYTCYVVIFSTYALQESFTADTVLSYEFKHYCMSQETKTRIVIL